MLLGRRAEREGDPWSGHVSLPGGRVDPEIRGRGRDGAPRDDVDAHGRVLGGLDLVHGHVRRARVQPVVAEVPRGLAPVPSHEHRHMWWAPAASLVPAIAPVRELPAPVPAFLVTDDAGEEHVLWGLAYRILTMLGEAVAAQRG